MSIKVVSEWLNACSGCEIAMVDMGSRLLTVLEHIEFVHIPVLMDHKYYGQKGDSNKIDIPEAEVGIISGSIRNEEHLEIAREIRKKCKIVIALGTCATHGGIPALGNSYTSQETLKRYYSTETTDAVEEYPCEGVPPLLDYCYALDEKIEVDLYFPGCPPHPDLIFKGLSTLLEGGTVSLPEKSVCDTCPTKRLGKGSVGEIKRFLHSPQEIDYNKPLSEMRCFLEQGYLCLGPVTRAGCGGDSGIPRCISARVPCRGCNGPVKHDGNQMLDILSALASNGINIESIPEFASLNRFCGGHGKLRPKLKL